MEVDWSNAGAGLMEQLGDLRRVRYIRFEESRAFGICLARSLNRKGRPTAD